MLYATYRIFFILYRLIVVAPVALSAGIFVAFALQSEFGEKTVPDRVVDLCLVLYVSSSLVVQTLLRRAHRALDGLSDGATPSRPASHLVALAVLLFLFVAPAYLTWLAFQSLGQGHEDDSEMIWTLVLVSSNVMNCSKAVGKCEAQFLRLKKNYS